MRVIVQMGENWYSLSILVIIWYQNIFKYLLNNNVYEKIANLHEERK